MARCAIISPMRDPLTKRMARPNSLAALGLKPGNTPVKLRFVTKPDQAPAAGYTLTARRVPDGQPRELGMTDRAGRIVLQPGFADGLVILRLLAGNVEPMVELPIMPGESRPDEQPIPFDPKPQTVALESQIDSLRDEVVDLVALRARLESRMKARLEGEDWNGLDATLKEFATLTPRDRFRPAAHASSRTTRPTSRRSSRRPILTKTAQAQISRPSVHDRPLPGRRHLQRLCRRTRTCPRRDRVPRRKRRPRKPPQVAAKKPAAPAPRQRAKTAKPAPPPAGEPGAAAASRPGQAAPPSVQRAIRRDRRCRIRGTFSPDQFTEASPRRPFPGRS